MMFASLFLVIICAFIDWLVHFILPSVLLKSSVNVISLCIGLFFLYIWSKRYCSSNIGFDCMCPAVLITTLSAFIIFVASAVVIIVTMFCACASGTQHLFWTTSVDPAGTSVCPLREPF